MHSNIPPPPEKPSLGILFMLQPEYADLIPAENKFEMAMNKAASEGRLFAPFELEGKYVQ